jgi:hypothetical protein
MGLRARTKHTSRPSRRAFFETLEERRLLALTWVAQAEFRATRDVVSEARSLRGLALSSDDSSIYGSFIQGTSSAAVRKYDADAPIPGLITAGSPAIEGNAVIFAQSKGLATDDRGYVYVNLDPFGKSPSVGFRVYSADLTTVLGNGSSTWTSSQLTGMSVHKEGGNYYLYMGRADGAATIERWDVTNPAAMTLDTSWGNSGRADLATLTGSANAFVNGLEVDADGTVYAAGGVLETGRGDSIFKISADGTQLLDSQSVTGAMDVALFGGKVYVSQYLANNSAISVNAASDLSFLETLTTGFIHTSTDSDSGYSGIDVSSTGKIFVADQIYDIQAPNRTHYERILVSDFVDDLPPVANGVSLLPNPVEFGAATSVTVTATIDDAATGAFFIAGAEYSLDGGTTWLPMAASDGAFDEVTEAVTATFAVSSLNPAAPGTFTILVRGTETAGNASNEASGVLTVVDTTAPVAGALALTPATVDTNYAGPVTITWSGSDNHRLALAEVSFDGGATWQPLPATDGATDEASETFQTTFTLAGAGFTTAGNYNILGRLTDATGNVSTVASVQLTVETPPPPPVSTKFVVGFDPVTGRWQGTTLPGSGVSETKQLAQWANIGQAGWHDALTGDFNGDGVTDVAARNYNGAWQVGASQPGGYATSIWGGFVAYLPWSSIQVGDVNADGKDDIVGYLPVSGEWWVAVSTGTSFQNQVLTRFSRSVGWTDFLVADFTGDGRADVAARSSFGEWWLGETNASLGTPSRLDKLATWSTLVAWRDVKAADMNGDGKADIVGRAVFGGFPVSQWWLAQTRLNAPNDYVGDVSALALWVEPVGWDVVIADTDGDGADEILGRTIYGEWWQASKQLGLNTARLGRWDFTAWLTTLAGDVDGDGKDDLIGRKGNGQWTVSRFPAGPGSQIDSNPAAWAANVAWLFTSLGEDDGTLFAPSLT